VFEELYTCNSTFAFERAPPVSFTVNETVEEVVAVIEVGFALAVTVNAGGDVPPVRVTDPALLFQ
jgi:hypothetical protein